MSESTITIYWKPVFDIVGNEFIDEPVELNYHDILEAEGEGRLRFIRAVERSDYQMLASLAFFKRSIVLSVG